MTRFIASFHRSSMPAGLTRLIIFFFTRCERAPLESLEALFGQPLQEVSRAD
jgi:hypothetical protein